MWSRSGIIRIIRAGIHHPTQTNTSSDHLNTNPVKVEFNRQFQMKQISFCICTRQCTNHHCIPSAKVSMGMGRSILPVWCEEESSSQARARDHCPPTAQVTSRGGEEGGGGASLHCTAPTPPLPALLRRKVHTAAACCSSGTRHPAAEARWPGLQHTAALQRCSCPGLPRYEPS